METRLILSYDHFKRNKISISMDRIPNNCKLLDVFGRYHPIARFLSFKIAEVHIKRDALQVQFNMERRTLYDKEFGLLRKSSFFCPLRIIVQCRIIESENNNEQNSFEFDELDNIGVFDESKKPKSHSSLKGNYQYTIEVFYQSKLLVRRVYKTRYPKLLNTSSFITDMIENECEEELDDYKKFDKEWIDIGLFPPFSIEFSDNMYQITDCQESIYLTGYSQAHSLDQFAKKLLNRHIDRTYVEGIIVDILKYIVNSFVELEVYLRLGYNEEIKTNPEFDPNYELGFESGKALLYTIKIHYIALMSLVKLFVEVDRIIEKIQKRSKLTCKNAVESYRKFLAVFHMIESISDSSIEYETGKVFRNYLNHFSQNPQDEITKRDGDRLRDLFIKALMRTDLTEDEIKKCVMDSQDLTNQLSVNTIKESEEEKKKKRSKSYSISVRCLCEKVLTALLNKELKYPLQRKPIPEEMIIDLRTENSNPKTSPSTNNFEVLMPFTRNSGPSATSYPKLTFIITPEMNIPVKSPSSWKIHRVILKKNKIMISYDNQNDTIFGECSVFLFYYRKEKALENCYESRK